MKKITVLFFALCILVLSACTTGGEKGHSAIENIEKFGYSLQR